MIEIRKEGQKIFHIYKLSRCPWCNTTPEFYMYLGSGEKLEQTFLPSVSCQNPNCPVQPKSKHVSIRKDQRFWLPTLHEKISNAIAKWNVFQDEGASEGCEICYTDLLEKIRELRGGY